MSDSAPDYLKTASQEIRFVNLSQEEKMMAEMMSKREADYWANITSAEDRGIEKIIHQLYHSGMSIETIAEHTEFSMDEIKSILEKRILS